MLPHFAKIQISDDKHTKAQAFSKYRIKNHIHSFRGTPDSLGLVIVSTPLRDLTQAHPYPWEIKSKKWGDLRMINTLCMYICTHNYVVFG